MFSEWRLTIFLIFLVHVSWAASIHDLMSKSPATSSWLANVVSCDAPAKTPCDHFWSVLGCQILYPPPPLKIPL